MAVITHPPVTFRCRCCGCPEECNSDEYWDSVVSIHFSWWTATAYRQGNGLGAECHLGFAPPGSWDGYWYSDGTVIDPAVMPKISQGSRYVVFQHASPVRHQHFVVEGYIPYPGCDGAVGDVWDNFLVRTVRYDRQLCKWQFGTADILTGENAWSYSNLPHDFVTCERLEATPIGDCFGDSSDYSAIENYQGDGGDGVGFWDQFSTCRRSIIVVNTVPSDSE